MPKAKTTAAPKGKGKTAAPGKGKGRKPAGKPRAKPAAPKEFGFKPLAYEDYTENFCGPAAFKVVSGRDDFCVVDYYAYAQGKESEIYKMPPLAGKGRLTGGVDYSTTLDVGKDLGLKELPDYKGQSLADALSQLAAEGYNYATVSFKGPKGLFGELTGAEQHHVFGIRNGVIMDVVDPRVHHRGSKTEVVTQVMARKGKPTDTQWLRLKSKVETERDSGRLREICLAELKKAEASYKRAINKAKKAGPGKYINKDMEAAFDIQNKAEAVAILRTFCDTGSPIASDEYCNRRIAEIKKQIGNKE